MKISTRNMFAATVRKLVHGSVSTEVTVRIAKGIDMVSVITTHSAKRLKLKKGGAAHVLIKADSVIIAVK
jgi:molybdopterin-binding protein